MCTASALQLPRCWGCSALDHCRRHVSCSARSQRSNFACRSLDEHRTYFHVVQRLFNQFGNAHRLTAVLDSSAAVTQLCRCQGFKQLSAKRVKASWDEKRGVHCLHHTKSSSEQ